MSEFATVAALSSLVGSVMATTSGVSGIGQVAIPTDPTVLTLFSAGVVGMSIKNVFDSILSDEDEENAGEQMSDGAGLMDEDGGDDLGGLGGFEDEGDDEFGDFGDDEFGDMDGGADTDELEHRLDELETEVGSLSSTVNTVRNENEQISETVDDVEENVRKLLDIYEMVTRGVNPFADDIEGGGLSGGGDGNSFGLFDNGQDESDDEDLDEDIANADAEGFFDDDLVEEDDESFNESVDDMMGDDVDDGGDPFEEEFNDDAFDDDGLDDDFDDDGLDDDFDDDGLDDSGMDEGGFEAETDSDDGGGGGKSFQELKDEYESGDADWAEEEAKPDETSSTEQDSPDDTDDSVADDADAFDSEAFETDESDGDVDDHDDELADDDLFDTVIEDDGESATAADGQLASETDGEAALTSEADDERDPDPDEVADAVDDEATSGASPVSGSESVTDEPSEAEAQPTPSTDTPSESEATATGEGKPYLAVMPEGFGSELIVIEWLEYLVEEVGIRSTAEAIDYYERIDWVSEPVADDLQEYLRGFDERGVDADLTIDHHTQSLKYIGQLNGTPGTQMGLSGGGSDGLQR